MQAGFDLGSMKGAGPPSKVMLVIQNRIAEMQKVVELVEQFGAAHGVPQAITNDLNQSLDELLNNTISYGYEDQTSHDIIISLLHTKHQLIAEIQDDGKIFDPRKTNPAIPSSPLQSRKIGGLGLHFVKSLMDDVRYTRVGQRNTTTIMKNLREGT